MDKRVADLERAVSDLSRSLEALRARIAEVEGHLGVYAAPASVDVSQPSLAVTEAADGTPVLSLVGRTCVVLGGGYLLRAITDGGLLPRAGGTALGLAYGIAWLIAAWRVLAAPRVANAAFHCIAAVLIAFPLLWEATARFHLLSQPAAALSIAAVTSIGLAIAWQRRVQTVAWIVAISGILAALAFLAATGAAPMALYLAYLGIVTLWLAYTLDWTWLRWPPAMVVDIVVLAMVADAASVWHHDQASGVMVVQLVLFAGYFVSFTVRTLWRSRQVVPFEVVQTLALLTVCFGGAVYLMLTTGSNARALGGASLAFAVGSYASAFAFVDWRGGHWRNFVFFASLGVVFTIAGTALVVAAPLQAVVWALLAVATAWGGRRYGTITLASHAAVYAIAAAVVSGLLAHAAAALSVPAVDAWSPLTLPATAVLAATALAAAIPLSGQNESWGRWSRVSKILVAGVLLWTAGGVVCGQAVPLLAGAPGTANVDAAVVATIRTVILALSVLLLAWAAGGFFVEGRWLSNMVLVAGGVKLLAEDFPQGRPATLFLSLAVYGGALILGPRLRARAARSLRARNSSVEPV